MFFVRYSTAQYEGDSTEEFRTEQEVVAFLNKHASSPDFKFDVIQGQRVVFEPVSIATQYRKK